MLLPLLGIAGLVYAAAKSDATVADSVRKIPGMGALFGGTGPGPELRTWMSAGVDGPVFLVPYGMSDEESAGLALQRAHGQPDPYAMGTSLPQGIYRVYTRGHGPTQAPMEQPERINVREPGVYVLRASDRPGPNGSFLFWTFRPPQGGEFQLPLHVRPRTGPVYTARGQDAGPPVEEGYGALDRPRVSRPPAVWALARSVREVRDRVRAHPGLALVYTFRPTCSMCTEIWPTLQAVGKELGPDTLLIKIDDKDLVRSAPHARLSPSDEESFLVAGVPTVRRFRGGRDDGELPDPVLEAALRDPAQSSRVARVLAWVRSGAPR